MSKKQEATRLLKAGLSPVEIAEQLGVGIATAAFYLYAQVGEGAIKRSDILFSIPQAKREFFEQKICELGSTKLGHLYRAIVGRGNNRDIHLLRIYLTLRDTRASMSDIYVLISEIEIKLHQFIKNILISEYGSDESGWWRQGVPPKIRAACAVAREEDPAPAKEAFCYTNFIHLQEIFDKQWDLFLQVLPEDFVNDKRGFLDHFTRLNHIRNCVIQPVKGLILTESDFAFVRSFYERVKLDRWNAIVP
jgi:hypothetical protein